MTKTTRKVVTGLTLHARTWDESKHPRDDAGRFARKGMGGRRWISRVLSQMRTGDLPNMAASTSKADVDRFFNVAAGAAPHPRLKPPTRPSPSPARAAAKPATAGGGRAVRYGSSAEAAEAAAKIPDDDLRAPALDRAAYASGVRTLRRLAAGAHSDVQRRKAAEQLLVARERTSQDGDADPVARQLRGMIDLWGGEGTAERGEVARAAARPARPAPVTIERPEQLSWGKSRNVLPQAMGGRGVETPQPLASVVDRPPAVGQGGKVASGPKLTKKQIKALHKFDEAGEPGALDELFIRERQPLLDAGYIEESSAKRAFVTSSKYYKLTDRGRARLAEADPEGIARRKTAVERKQAREAALVERARIAQEKRDAKLVKDLKTAEKEGLDPSVVRMFGLESARKRKTEDKEKARAEKKERINLGVPEYKPGGGRGKSAPRPYRNLVTNFGASDRDRRSLLGKMKKDGITLTEDERAQITKKFQAHLAAMTEVDIAAEDVRNAKLRRRYLATVRDIEGGVEYDYPTAEAGVDIDDAQKNLDAKIEAAKATGQEITDDALSIYAARGKKKTARGIGTPMPGQVGTEPTDYYSLQSRYEKDLPYGAADDPRAVDLRKATLARLRASDEVTKRADALEAAKTERAAALRELGYPGVDKTKARERAAAAQEAVSEANSRVAAAQGLRAEASKRYSDLWSEYRKLPSVDAFPKDTPERRKLLERINAGEGPAFSEVTPFGRKYTWVERSDREPSTWYVMTAYEGQPADRGIAYSEKDARERVNRARGMSAQLHVRVDEITAEQAEENARIRNEREEKERTARVEEAVAKYRTMSQPQPEEPTEKPKIYPAKRGDYVVISSQATDYSSGRREAVERHEVYEVASVSPEGLVTMVRPITGGSRKRVQSMGDVRVNTISGDKIDLEAAKGKLLTESTIPSGVPRFDNISDIRAILMPYRKDAPVAPASAEKPKTARKVDPMKLAIGDVIDHEGKPATVTGHAFAERVGVGNWTKVPVQLEDGTEQTITYRRSENVTRLQKAAPMPPPSTTPTFANNAAPARPGDLAMVTRTTTTGTGNIQTRQSTMILEVAAVDANGQPTKMRPIEPGSMTYTIEGLPAIMGGGGLSVNVLPRKSLDPNQARDIIRAHRGEYGQSVEPWNGEADAMKSLRPALLKPGETPAPVEMRHRPGETRYDPNEPEHGVTEADMFKRLQREAMAEYDEPPAPTPKPAVRKPTMGKKAARDLKPGDRFTRSTGEEVETVKTEHGTVGEKKVTRVTFRRDDGTEGRLLLERSTGVPIASTRVSRGEADTVDTTTPDPAAAAALAAIQDNPQWRSGNLTLGGALTQALTGETGAINLRGPSAEQEKSLDRAIKTIADDLGVSEDQAWSMTSREIDSRATAKAADKARGTTPAAPPADTGTAGARLARERGITPDQQMLDTDIVKSRGKWSVRMRDETGRSVGSKDFTTKREAEAWVVDAQATRTRIAAAQAEDVKRHQAQAAALLGGEPELVPSGELQPGNRFVYATSIARPRETGPEVFTVAENRGTAITTTSRDAFPVTGGEHSMVYRVAGEPPAPATPENVAAAHKDLVDSVISVARREDALDQIAADVTETTKRDLRKRLDLVFDGDRIADRAATLSGEIARSEAIEADKKRTLAELRQISTDAAETPARRKAAEELAARVETLRVPDVAAQRRELTGLQADIGSLELFGERRRDAARQVGVDEIRRRARADADAELAELFGNRDYKRTLERDQQDAADEYLRQRELAATREYQRDEVRRQAQESADVAAVMRSEQGRAAAVAWQQRDEGDIRARSEEAETAGYRAENARAGLVGEALRRKAAAEATERRREVEAARRQAEASPEVLDRQESARVERELAEAFRALGPADPEGALKKEASRRRRAAKVPAESSMKKLSFEKRHFARQAGLAIQNEVAAPAVARRQQVMIELVEGKLADPELRPATREKLVKTLEGYRKGYVPGRPATSPVTDADVAEFTARREMYMEAWRAANMASPGTAGAGFSAGQLDGLSQAEKQLVLDLDSMIGHDAALRLLAWLRDRK